MLDRWQERAQNSGPPKASTPESTTSGAHHHPPRAGIGPLQDNGRSHHSTGHAYAGHTCVQSQCARGATPPLGGAAGAVRKAALKA